MLTIYGIKNCDTMKKAMLWLTQHDIAFTFHDYKKDGVPTADVKQWIEQHGWDQLINKRGTSWRALDETTKNKMDNEQALICILNNPALIKRPFLIKNNEHIIGFSEKNYLQHFS